MTYFDQPLQWDVSSGTMFWVCCHELTTLNLDRILSHSLFYSTISQSTFYWIDLYMSDCTKSKINKVFSVNPLWNCTDMPSHITGCGNYRWGYTVCPPPPLFPPPSAPPNSVTKLNIRGQRSQIVFGPNDDCTLELTTGATSSLTSTCPITTPSSGRRLEDTMSTNDLISELNNKLQKLEVANSELKEQVEFLAKEVKTLKEDIPSATKKIR